MFYGYQLSVTGYRLRAWIVTIPTAECACGIPWGMNANHNQRYEGSPYGIPRPYQGRMRKSYIKEKCRRGSHGHSAASLVPVHSLRHEY